MAQSVVLGIDPSERGCGVVCIPANWRRRFSAVRAVTLEIEPKATTAACRLKALVRMGMDAVILARECGITHAWIEAPPTHGAHNMHRVLEVAHVIRHELWRECGIAAEWAPQSSARKLLLGKLPQGGRKAIVRSVVDSLHRFEDGDQADAFVAANWGLSQLDLPCFVGAEVAA